MEGSGPFCDLFYSYPCFPKSPFLFLCPQSTSNQCLQARLASEHVRGWTLAESLRSPSFRSSVLLSFSSIPGLHHSV